ncbi:MAG: periplasmic heavy metal sensor [Candidatus Eisenbacteria bacterium]|nr:periplasmic heavy metal sensor [Candidatus Eisenbacteria bacterium]
MQLTLWKQRMIWMLAAVLAAGLTLAAVDDAAAACGRGHHAPRAPGMGEGGCGHDRGMGLMRLESLTDEQRDKLAALRDAAQKEMISLRSDLAALRVDLRAVMREDEPDRAKAAELARRMGELRGKIQARRLTLRIDMGGLLTGEQKAELKEMRRECRQDCRTHHRRGGRGRGRPHGWRHSPPPAPPAPGEPPETEL